MRPTPRHRPLARPLRLAAMGGALLVVGPGCGEAPEAPVVDRVEPGSARPGATIAIEGSGFGESADGVVVKLGQVEVPAERRGGDTLVVELPGHLQAGTYPLTVGNRFTEKVSAPVELQVIDAIALPTGTELRVRTGATLSSQSDRAGDTFPATLAQPLIVDGRTVAQAGSRVVGRITRAEASGRIRGVAELAFTPIELEALDGTRKLNLVTDSFHSRARPTKKRDAAKSGGAAAGAVIGGLVGGKKGALTGAGAGGAAGTGAVLATRGHSVEVPAGTEVTFVLRQPIELEVPPTKVASSQ